MLTEDRHAGKCGHCSTAVPLDAVVCTGCGARWGSSGGKTRQAVYEEGKAKAIIGAAMITLLLGSFILAAYFESPWVLLVMIAGVLVGLPSLRLLIDGLILMRRAKTNLKITWWRDG